MRFRLMATYRGAQYEAGIGPTDRDVVLFAALPPPEVLRFDPAPGYWRKQVRVEEVQALWESRPVGTFRGERCLVLDDLGDRLHIAYLGHDAYRAEQIGYWQVDRGVFELITPHGEVADVAEQRREYHYPYRSGLGPGTGPLPSIGKVPVTGPTPSASNGPPPAAAPVASGLRPDPGGWGRAGTAAAGADPRWRDGTVTPQAPARGNPEVALPPPASRPLPLEAAALRAATAAPAAPAAAPVTQAAAPAAVTPGAPVTSATGPAPPAAFGAGPATGTVPAGTFPPGAVQARRHRGDRARVSAQQTFAELAGQAAIPAGSYALGAEREGAMCLMQAASGWQVFSFAGGARHETRQFTDEESAYFYLFGVLTAEAVRTGMLAPRG